MKWVQEQVNNMDETVTEHTVYIDMDYVNRIIGVDQGWKTCNPEQVEQLKQYILGELDYSTDQVKMVGKFPATIGMIITGLLAERVRRFEFGEPRGIRTVIFDYESCPEMRT